MAENHSSKKSGGTKKRFPVLPVAAAVILAVAAGITLIPRLSTAKQDAGEGISCKIEQGQLVFSTTQITSNVKYIDYSSDGIAMQLMAVKDSSGKNHVTLNTCQNCGGSPMAFFEQEGSRVTCQNCGISHNISQMGQQKIGCNPIPLNYTEKDGKITIALPELDQYARIFVNWKKGV